MVRSRYSSSSRATRAATSAAVAIVQGCWQRSEPVDHLGRGHGVADPQAGEGEDLGHRPQDDHVVAGRRRADQGALVLVGQEGQDRPRRRPTAGRASGRSARAGDRGPRPGAVGLLGCPVQKIPVRLLGEDLLDPAQDVVVPDLGAQAVLRRGPAVLAVGRLDQVGRRGSRDRPARGRGGSGDRA